MRDLTRLNNLQLRKIIEDLRKEVAIRKEREHQLLLALNKAHERIKDLRESLRISSEQGFKRFSEREAIKRGVEVEHQIRPHQSGEERHEERGSIGVITQESRKGQKLSFEKHGKVFGHSGVYTQDFSPHTKEMHRTISSQYAGRDHEPIRIYTLVDANNALLLERWVELGRDPADFPKSIHTPAFPTYASESYLNHALQGHEPYYSALVKSGAVDRLLDGDLPRSGQALAYIVKEYADENGIPWRSPDTL